MKKTIKKDGSKEIKYPFESVVAAFTTLFSEKGKRIPKVVVISEKCVFKSQDGMQENWERTLHIKRSKHLQGNVENMLVIQRTNLNRLSKKMEVQSHNTNFTDQINIIDKWTFMFDPTNSQWTEWTVLKIEFCIDVYTLELKIGAKKIKKRYEEKNKELVRLIEQELQDRQCQESMEMNRSKSVHKIPKGNPIHAYSITEENDVGVENIPESVTEENDVGVEDIPESVTEENDVGVENIPESVTEENDFGVENIPESVTEENDVGVENIPESVTEENDVGVENIPESVTEENDVGVENIPESVTEENDVGVENIPESVTEENDVGVENIPESVTEENGVGVENIPESVTEENDVGVENIPESVTEENDIGVEIPTELDRNEVRDVILPYWNPVRTILYNEEKSTYVLPVFLPKTIFTI